MLARENELIATNQRIERLVQRIDVAWADLQESYAGLTDRRMMEPGVMDGWSVKDILAHVTTWEEEALKHLPTIMAGGRPPRYVTFGGIDAFNERMSEQKRVLDLSDVQQQLTATHQRLIDFVRGVPADLLAPESRVRRRLRLDTYSHYPLHARAIREWRGLQSNA